MKCDTCVNENKGFREDPCVLCKHYKRDDYYQKADKECDGKITPHWLEVAHERWRAGEKEVDILDDYGYVRKEEPDYIKQANKWLADDKPEDKSCETCKQVTKKADICGLCCAENNMKYWKPKEPEPFGARNCATCFIKNPKEDHYCFGCAAHNKWQPKPTEAVPEVPFKQQIHNIYTDSDNRERDIKLNALIDCVSYLMERTK